jgi:hypothetical protein
MPCNRTLPASLHSSREYHVANHRFRRLGVFPGFIVPVSLAVLLVGWMGRPASAKNIFDDGWDPPAPAKPATPPPGAGAAKPSPTPEPGRPSPPSGAQPANPPPPSAVVVRGRRPIPSAADQAKSRKLFREIFAADLADRSAPARRALGTKLLQQAATLAAAPADAFVLLVGATDAGREAGDLSLSCRAADSLGESYEVDALRVKSDVAMKMALRGDSAATAADNCRTGLKLADELVAAEDDATALRLLQLLRPAAPDPNLSAQIQARIRENETARSAAERVAPYIQRLKAAPDDPAANLAVGQYFCFTKHDWKQGLPLLSKGTKTPSGPALQSRDRWSRPPGRPERPCKRSCGSRERDRRSRLCSEGAGRTPRSLAPTLCVAVSSAPCPRASPL